VDRAIDGIPSVPSGPSGGFAQTVVDVHGEAGLRWLDRLPDLVAECESRWSLSVMPPFAPLSYNYVAPAVRADGSEAVLKLGVPHRELVTEIEALRLFEGRGTARLLEADVDRGAIVLERLRPGAPLSDILDDDQAASVAAALMTRLNRPAPPDHPFPTVVDWAAGLRRLRVRFDGGTGPLPAPLVEKAESLFSELIDTMGPPVVLHGDLHHGNILSAEREPWVAVDPKGVVGEAEYEVGAFLRNRLLVQSRPEAALARRVDRFATELGVDRERVVGWGLAQAVLSAWWTYEDHGRVSQESIPCAELLSTL
jgi:streptomycin 6-kinase